MNLEWTTRAIADLARVRDHLQPIAPEAAARITLKLAQAPYRLLDYPRIGEKLDAYLPREVRRVIIGSYELRYEIANGTIFVLRIWHCREDRGFGPDDGE